MEKHIIEIRELYKNYGSQIAVENLTLDIKEGEVFGLLGPNGAGKSTTIRMILGFLEPTSGSITIDGFSSVQESLQVKKIVGYLPEDIGFYNQLSGIDNLMYTARLNRIPIGLAEKRVKKLLELVELTNDANKKVGAYSRGMRQRLGLADVLVKKPKIIILDEPTLGLDPKGMQNLLNQISELSKNEGLTVMFSSHHLQQVQHICDRVGLFIKGKLIASGEIQSLSDQLFSSKNYDIEARIELKDSPTTSENCIEKLLDSIQKLKNVDSILVDNDLLKIECQSDASIDIAKTIISNSYGLKSLKKKEFGLDDIYNKYFEGGI